MKTILVVLCLLSLKIYSQETYPLHPAVGDTISLMEKIDYALFPEISNKQFAFLTITYAESRFYLKSYDSISMLISIDTAFIEEIVEAQKNIEKINAYYSIKAEGNTSSESVMFTKNTKQTLSPFSYNVKEKPQKEARMEVRLSEAKKRSHERQKGYRPSSILIELK